MTAINIFRKSNRISILTDGAAYSGDGVLVARVNKCVPIPHLSAAVACRGPSIAAATLAAHLALWFETFDELISEIDRFLPRWLAEFDDLLLGQAVQAFIAGWSERSGEPGSYVITTTDYQPGMDAGTLYPIDAFSAAPLPTADDFAAVNWPATLNAQNFRPDRDGVLLMEAQRHMVVPVTADDEDAPEGHIVGVHACLTEITPDSVTQRIIHRWPDEIGELITPASFSVASASALPMLSRQQRRAAERKARKAS